MYLPNDFILLRAYAIGLSAFEKKNNNMVYRCAVLMHNRSVRLGLARPLALRIWER